jgi:hypothetical protein
MTDLAPSGGRFTLWQAIVIAASVAVVSAGAGWTAGRTLLGDELDQYRKAENWKVPDAIRQLTELTARLNVTLEERTRLQQAVKSVEELKATNDRTTKELAERKREMEGLQSRVKNLEGDTFVLEVGKTRFVLGRELALGVTGTNKYTRECMVQFGDREERIRPGRTLTESRGNLRARVTLLEVVGDTCRFSIAR